MKLFLFATLFEAKSTLTALKARPESDELYRYDNGWIGLTGFGSYNALFTATRLLPLASEVINIGIAGSLKDDLQVGSIHEISLVNNWVAPPLILDDRSEQILETHLPSLHLEPGHLRLLTVPFPIHEATFRKELGKKWDLVDMEGYGIAFAARLFKKKCSLCKVVSDLATQGGRELIEKNREALSELLAKWVLKNESRNHQRI